MNHETNVLSKRLESNSNFSPGELEVDWTSSNNFLVSEHPFSPSLKNGLMMNDNSEMACELSSPHCKDRIQQIVHHSSVSHTIPESLHEDSSNVKESEAPFNHLYTHQVDASHDDQLNKSNQEIMSTNQEEVPRSNLWVYCKESPPSPNSRKVHFQAKSPLLSPSFLDQVLETDSTSDASPYPLNRMPSASSSSTMLRGTVTTQSKSQGESESSPASIGLVQSIRSFTVPSSKPSKRRRGRETKYKKHRPNPCCLLFLSPLEFKFLKKYMGGYLAIKYRCLLLLLPILICMFMGLSFLHATNVWSIFTTFSITFFLIFLCCCCSCFCIHPICLEISLLMILILLGIGFSIADAFMFTHTPFPYHIFLNALIGVYLFRVRWIFSCYMFTFPIIFIIADAIINSYSEVLGSHLTMYIVNFLIVFFVVIEWRRLEKLFRSNFLREHRLKYDELEMKDRVDDSLKLLQNILPSELVDKLNSRVDFEDNVSDTSSILSQNSIPYLNSRLKSSFFQKKSTTVVFIDICQFSRYCSEVNAKDLIFNLNHLFKSFDHLVKRFSMTKIKTVGDAYCCVSGIKEIPNKSHQRSGCEFAMMCMHRKNQLARDLDWPLNIRVGVACGSSIFGLFGNHLINFDIWGKTVVIAEHLEEKANNGSILVSEKVQMKAQPFIEFTAREDSIEIPGLEQPINAFYLSDGKISKDASADDTISVQVKPSPCKSPHSSIGSPLYVESGVKVSPSFTGTKRDDLIKETKNSELSPIISRFEKVTDGSNFESFKYSSHVTSTKSSKVEAIDHHRILLMQTKAKKYRPWINYICNCFCNPRTEGKFYNDFFSKTRWFTLFFFSIVMIADAANIMSCLSISEFQNAAEWRTIFLYCIFGYHMLVIIYYMLVYPCCVLLLPMFVQLTFSRFTKTVMIIPYLVVPFLFLKNPLMLLQTVLFAVAIVNYPLHVPPIIKSIISSVFTVVCFTTHLIFEWSEDSLGSFIFVMIFSFLWMSSNYVQVLNLRKSYLLRSRLQYEAKRIKEMDHLIEKLISSSMPVEIYHRLRGTKEPVIDWIPSGSILFIKLCGLNTKMFHSQDILDSLSVLEKLFDAFDEIVVEEKTVTKVKSSGDSYVIRSGEDSKILYVANHLMEISKRILNSIEASDHGFYVLMGCHQGPFACAVLGITRLTYDTFASTVNYAARLCHSSHPFRIQVSEAIYETRHNLENLQFVQRDSMIDLKGIGTVQAYFIQSIDDHSEDNDMD